MTDPKGGGEWFEDGGPYRVKYIQSKQYTIVAHGIETPRGFSEDESKTICLWLNHAHRNALSAEREAVKGLVEKVEIVCKSDSLSPIFHQRVKDLFCELEKYRAATKGE